MNQNLVIFFFKSAPPSLIQPLESNLEASENSICLLEALISGIPVPIASWLV